MTETPGRTPDATSHTNSASTIGTWWGDDKDDQGIFSTETGYGLLSVPILDDKNYREWSVGIENILRLRGLWSAVASLTTPGVHAITPAVPDGVAAKKEPAPLRTAAGASRASAAPVEVLAEAARIDEHARSTLILSVKGHHNATIYRHTMACGAWEALAASFRPRGTARTTNLRWHLNRLQMGRGESVTHTSTAESP